MWVQKRTTSTSRSRRTLLSYIIKWFAISSILWVWILLTSSPLPPIWTASALALVTSPPPLSYTSSEINQHLPIGISNNTICQDPGCTESPYAVYVRDNFFLPPYLTVPPGNTVSFIPASTYEHTVTSSPAIADCSSSSGFNIDMPGFFSPPVEVAFDTLGTFPFKDNFYCSTGMYGLINVTTLAENPSPAPSSSDASPSLLSSSWAGLIW